MLLLLLLLLCTYLHQPRSVFLAHSAVYALHGHEIEMEMKLELWGPSSKFSALRCCCCCFLTMACFRALLKFIYQMCFPGVGFNFSVGIVGFHDEHESNNSTMYTLLHRSLTLGYFSNSFIPICWIIISLLSCWRWCDLEICLVSLLVFYHLGIL